jgi:hypothetical protein
LGEFFDGEVFVGEPLEPYPFAVFTIFHGKLPYQNLSTRNVNNHEVYVKLIVTWHVFS